MDIPLRRPIADLLPQLSAWSMSMLPCRRLVSDWKVGAQRHLVLSTMIYRMFTSLSYFPPLPDGLLSVNCLGL